MAKAITMRSLIEGIQKVKKTSVKEYVTCIDIAGYTVSLKLNKVYRKLGPKTGDPKNFIRIVDESGEDYLYPKKYFKS